MNDRVAIAESLVWPAVVRPRLPLVYLDLNHYIYLARLQQGDQRVPAGYDRLLESALRAKEEDRATFPLSGEHLFEVLAIKDPAQRTDIAAAMEALSGFQYMMGRPEIAHLELEAGINVLQGEPLRLPPIPLLGQSFLWAFGKKGGLRVLGPDGDDASQDMRHQMGSKAFDEWLNAANRYAERAMLQGPPDDEIAHLRTMGYQPERARDGHQSRLAFELDLSQMLATDPKWRRGRLRDLVSGREIAHEWLDTFNRIQQERTEAGGQPFNPGDDAMLALLSALPHIQVAIAIKTAYHRNPTHQWTTNDITDIDALSVAYPYCDAVLTDKAIRSAITRDRDLRRIPTYLPRTPLQLADWLDQQPALSQPWLLVPASKTLAPSATRNRRRAQQTTSAGDSDTD